MTDFGKNFPIDKYYRENIVDARTVSRKGAWWSAVVLIKDPRNDTRFLGLYKWQHVSGAWKVKGKLNIRRKKDGQELAEAIAEFIDRLPT